jgi:hypothetical protein
MPPASTKRPTHLKTEISDGGEINQDVHVPAFRLEDGLSPE